jgi:imidazole glycerol-phosphate synthase subunit HisH
MSRTKITVVDYGVGNLLSVQRAFEYCGSNVLLASDPDSILSAERVVLPGVGAFENAMQALKDRGLVKPLKQLAEKGTPLLGICLGMQLLFDESEEFGLTEGLGLIPGRVVRLPSITVTGKAQKIPHIGWNLLSLAESQHSWGKTILQDNLPGDATYYVHSFMSVPSISEHRIADCFYGGHRIPAVVAMNRIYGCQFHPEKSGEVGLRIIRRFCAD